MSNFNSKPVIKTMSATEKVFTRFELTQRIEHFLLLVSFTMLGVTGLAQKFASSPISQAIIYVLGGIETTRIFHRIAAVVLIAVSILHIVMLLYRLFVLRLSPTILPSIDDFKHLFQDILFYIGKNAKKAAYGRYSYAEKVEYFAVVWGTVIMAITGFMMWNPIATTRVLPGEAIPAAKAAHGGEAILAVLAIIIWHFYNVHIRHFNKSMFTGKLTKEEMEHEHPAELVDIEAGRAGVHSSPAAIRRREQYFIPVAGVLILGLGFGLVKFATFEKTAIATLPRGETAPIFVPITPTPTVTPAPTATAIPVQGAVANSWDGGIKDILFNRCNACHIQGNLGGLSLGTYQSALKGGQNGPVIVPGDPQASQLIVIQSAGGHPGQLTQDELAKIIEWIKAGAPEK